MKTLFIMLDSLNRHYLNAYGPSWVQTPNIDRLAQRGLVFDNHFCCSMPCMPARRDLFTGHVNFLETPWSPIQPWDDCLQPELRRQQGTYSHLITDHYHYYHSGGEFYHVQFNSWEFQRGQEGDVWRPVVDLPEPPAFRGKNRRAYWANRAFQDSERDEEYPTPQCFMRAIDFLEHNHQADNWHLHLECFDPHEPFACPEKYRALYDDIWKRDYHFDWPDYAPLADDEDNEAVAHIRKAYAGTLTMADVWLGKLLDKMDELDLWKDTTVVFTTDHGHLLGEHGYWAKNYMFDYKELVHIPLIVCTPDAEPGRRQGLTSTIDLMPTFMDLHQGQLPPHVHGRSIAPLLAADAPHHEAVLYGYFGKDINLTDGRHTYCRQALPDSHLHHHTAVPCVFPDPATQMSPHTRRQALAQAETGVFLPHAHGIPHYRMEVPSRHHHNAPDFNPIYDIVDDPEQQNPLRDGPLEDRLAAQMKDLLDGYGAPACQYERMGL
ncbi:MAG: sulfatase-like hydrolase/transferase [Candidatus Latescibacteria bacterium]|nr:sulfatase-like hydrolase/transferase [Candidatus Latescibacterota bacterium]